MRASLMASLTLGLLFVACGGSSDEETKELRDQVSALQTQLLERSATSTPASPTSTSLESRKDSARAEAVLGIQITVTSAKQVMSYVNRAVELASVDSPTDIMTSQLTRVVRECERYTERYEVRFQPTLDLWPSEFVKVRLELMRACDAIVTPAPFSWDVLLQRKAAALRLTVLDPLSAAVDALPDYSSAQLERAVAARQ